MPNLIVLDESYQEVVEMDDETEGMEENLVIVNISADMTREEVMRKASPFGRQGP